MAEPAWMSAPPVVQSPAWKSAPPADQAQTAPTGPASKPFSILPFSEDRQGNVNFDSDAGVVGALKRTVQLPAQVYRGEVDPYSQGGADRTLEAALTATPLGVAARAAPGGLLSGARSYRQPVKPVPTRDEIGAAVTEGYTNARDLGAAYKPSSIADWATNTANGLDADGRIAENFPKVHALLNRLKNPPESSDDESVTVTLETLDALHRALGKIGADPNEGDAASFVQRQLGEFQNNMGVADVVSGAASPQEALRLIRDARGNAAAGFRSDRITGVEDTIGLRSDAANSGRNFDNTTRQRLASLLLSAKGSRGLSEAEEAAIRQVIEGTPGKNTARYVGNTLGGGGGLGQTLLGLAAGGGGMATMGPGGLALGLLPPAVGAGARTIANRMSRRELKELDELMRSRSPLAQNTPLPPPMYQPGLGQGSGETMIKALGASNLPVYEPKPRQGPPQLNSKMIRALIGPDGA
jgi:hypothetical protein